MHVSGKFLVTLSRGYDRKLFLSFHDVHMIINYILNMDTYKSRSSNFLHVSTFPHAYFWMTICSVSENLLANFFWLFLFLKWQKGIKIPSSDGLNQNIVIEYIQAKHFERFREFFCNCLYLISLNKQFWFKPFM